MDAFSLEKISIIIPTPDFVFISLKLDIVETDVLSLIGLDVFEKYEPVADNMDDILNSKMFGWKMLIVQKEGKLFLVW